MQNQPVFETKRLIMRRWRESDAAALYKYASDERVSALALWPRHTSIEMSRYVINEIFGPNQYCFAIVDKTTDEAIGCIGLVPAGNEHHKILNNEFEAGYWLGYEHWGKGLASEALEGLTKWCRDELRLESLLITADAQNIASCRVAEKCGFKHVENYCFNGILSKAFRLRL